MNIAGIVPNSTVDYPKTLAVVLFTNGCNLNCFYCHNRQLIDGSATLLNEDTVFEFLHKRKNYINGVVITGGEPTIQKNIDVFIKKVLSLGYKIKLDTNGSNPEIIKELINQKLLDYVSVDYKAPWSEYEKLCRYDCSENVQKTIEILQKGNIKLEVRTTVIPHISKEEYVNMAREISILECYTLNQYKMPKRYLLGDKLRLDMKSYSIVELKEIEKTVKEYQPNVKLKI